MPGFQPRFLTDPVWVDGTNVNDCTAAGLGFRISAVYGWDDRVDVRDVRELRSGQDGENADDLFLGGRTITFEGEVFGSSWRDLQARKRALAAIYTPSSAEKLIKIADPATTTPTAVYATTGMAGYERASARVVESIVFGDLTSPSSQKYQVVFRASDPRIYSDVETSTDSGTTGTVARTVTVDQSGNYPTPVALTVTGTTGTDWSVTTSDVSTALVVSGLTLASGVTVKAETPDRTLVISGDYKLPRLAGAYAASGLWPLNETSGTTADNAQGVAARDATYTGGFTLNQTGPFTGAQSVTLNGSSGYVAVPNQTALYGPNSAGSVTAMEVWVKFNTLAGTQTIFDSLASNKGYSVYRLSDGRWAVEFGVSINTFAVAMSGAGLSAMTTGVWYRIKTELTPSTTPASTRVSFCVYSTSGTVIYESTTTPTGAFYTMVKQTAGGMRFGASLAGTNFFSGGMALAAIYADTTEAAMDLLPANGTTPASVYQYMLARSSRWSLLGTGSTTFQLDSTGLTTGSKLNVSYRDARL